MEKDPVYKDILRAGACGLAVSLFAICLVFVGCSKREVRVEPVSMKEVGASIDMAAGYLKTVCLPNGRFIYRKHIESKKKYRDKYNVLRHAGTIYALGMYFSRTNDKETLEAMKRASRYLIDEFADPVPLFENALAIWSKPEKIGYKASSKPLQAKLGGTGLGLVALISLERAAPGSIPLTTLQKLARFLVSMQKKDGSFYSKYFAKEGPSDAWTSLYYPGEAMLGLLMLHDLDPNREWLETAAKGMAYLASERKGWRKIPADHWALLATKKLLPKYRQLETPPVPRDDILGHAVAICKKILSDQLIEPGDPRVHGSFYKDARISPASTHLEGLLAARTFLTGEYEKLSKRIDKAAEMGVGFLVRTQAKSGRMAGALPRAARKLAEEKNENDRKFNARAGEVRVDYVQHALSAMIQYEGLYSGSKNGR